MDDLLQEMIDPEPPRRDAARRRRLWATVAVLGLAGVGVTSLTTSALFTDTDTVAGDLVTGTVDISSTYSTPIDFPVEGIAPNGTYNGQVSVTNAGSLALRYAVRYSATQKTTGLTPAPTLGTTVTPGDLRDVLSLAVYPPAAGSTCATTTPPTGTGTSSTTGAVASLDTSGAFVTLLGNPTDKTTYRTLASTKTEVLCVTVHMDTGAGNEYQATGAHLTLEFDSEQTVNNP